MGTRYHRSLGQKREGLVSSLGRYKKSFRSKSRGLAPPPGLNVNFPGGLGLDPASEIAAAKLSPPVQVGSWAGPLHQAKSEQNRVCDAR